MEDDLYEATSLLLKKTRNLTSQKLMKPTPGTPSLMIVLRFVPVTNLIQNGSGCTELIVDRHERTEKKGKKG